MMVAGHVVYLGSEPAAVVDLAGTDSVPGELTVSVAGSPDAAVTLLRSPRVDCLVVEDESVAKLDAFLERAATAVPSASLLVHETAADEPAIDSDRVDGTITTSAPPVDRWERLARHFDPGDATESDTQPGAVDGIPAALNWTGRGLDDATATDVAASLSDAPSVVNTFLDRMLDIFFVFDLDLNFQLWNDSLNEALGYDDAEIESMSPLDFIVEADHAEALAGIETILETGSATAEFTLRSSDGTEIPYSFTGSLIEGEGGPYISGVGRDISARKERERELRRERDLTNRILETNPVAIVVCDADGTIRRANSRATNLLGISRTSTDDSHSIASEWPLYDENEGVMAAADNPFRRVVRTSEPVYGYTHHIELPEGEERWLSTSVAPLHDESGTVSSVIVAIDDITQLKERERQLTRRTRELDQAVEELQRSNAELEQFAYVASHDLKEPLRMISNYLGLLERRYADELDQDAQDFIDYAIDGAERMRDFINGLLKYSRTQRHDDPLEPVDTTAVLDTVHSNLSVAIEETDAQVTSDALPTVLGHRNHLVRLFQNLVSNAITYAGDDPPRIHVSAEPQEEMYRFAVADEGPGIDPAAVDKVFDIFYSGDDSDSTGIGLAICKKVVNNHDGRIWVDTDPGEGTTVYFTLPAENADRSAVGASLTSTGD